MTIRGSRLLAAAPPGEILRFDVFEVDVLAGELRKQGVKIKLQEQPFQVLLALLEKPGEIVTRKELQKRVWPSDTFVDFDHGISNGIKRVREALCDSPDRPRYIETIPRKGYRFIGEVQRNGHVAFPTHNANLEAHGAWPKLLGVTGVMLVVAGAFVLNVRGWRERLWPTSDSMQIKSIVVLPFSNLSNDTKDGYFAAGFSDAVRTALARIGSLRVVSRTTAEIYPREGKSAPEIARELSVEGIVEGTI